MGILESFESILYNVFKPLFEVTVDPASHPQLHVFLKFVRILLLSRILEDISIIIIIYTYIACKIRLF